MQQSVDQFVAWNLRILEAFFSAAFRNEEVWLSLDPVELDAIGPDLGGDAGLQAAVRQGPPWPSALLNGRILPRPFAGAFADRCLGLVEQRKRSFQRPPGYVDPGELRVAYQGTAAPTYLPYLAAMVRCAAAQDEQGFYAELRRCLKLPDTWHSQDMARLIPVWEDLQVWTETQGRCFGHFVVRRLGGYVHVGIPRSQSIISSRDVAKLGRLFAEVPIDPDAPVTDEIVEQAYQAAARSESLSHPLRLALSIPAFTSTVRERLRSLIAEWDGPRSDDELARELEVALTLSDGNSLPWAVSWLVPPIRDEGHGRLLHGESEWQVTFRGTQSVLTSSSAPSATALLAQSESADLPFELHIRTTEGGPNEVQCGLVLRTGILRTLIPQAGPQSPQVLLVERPLPFNGSAYVLAAPSNVDRLQTLLRTHHVSFEPCPADGLPAGWELVCVLDCTSVPEHFRTKLPTGDGVSRQARALRLVGGRALSRGGIRQYLPYDLPWLEVDAPQEVRLDSPGLRLTEHTNIVADLDGGPVRHLPAIRRFRIEVEHAGSSSFTIHAGLNARHVGEARLRIAPSGGLDAVPGQSFHLSELGEPWSAPHGLSGVLRGVAARVTAQGEAREPRQRVSGLGITSRPEDTARYLKRVAVQFMDTLAQMGSIAYGAARDQLSRLIDRDCIPLSPVEVLLSLRSRGFIEVEVDVRGRLSRIHSVAPALCVLEHTEYRGGAIALPVGTLRLAHWDLFCAGAHDAVTGFRDSDVDSAVLPGVWLVGDRHGIETIAAVAALPVIEGAAKSLAHWASGLDEFEDALTERSVESMGHRLPQLQQFHPDSGRFLPVSQAHPSPDSRYVMFRVEDPETNSHKIHSIAYLDSTARARFSFVRDSRWGIWLALASFSRYVRDVLGDHEVCPWPLHHDPEDHTLWIPARLNVPLVLERALVLCSGDLPVVRRLQGRTAGDALRLWDASSQRDYGGVSRVYHGYIMDSNAQAIWLGYRWVTPSVAEEVAKKLGATIKPLER